MKSSYVGTISVEIAALLYPRVLAFPNRESYGWAPKQTASITPSYTLR